MSDVVTRDVLEREMKAAHDQLAALVRQANEQSQKAVHDKVDAELKSEINRLGKELLDKGEKMKETMEQFLADAKKREKVLTESSVSPFARAFAEKLGNESLRGKVGGGARISMSFPELTGKTVGTMTTSASTGSGVIPADYVPGIIEAGRAKTTIRTLFRQGTTDSDTVRFIRAVAGEGAVAPTAEGSAKPQLDRDFTAHDASVETIAGYARISKQLLDNLSVLRTYLPNWLAYEVSEIESAQLLYGNGTTPNLSGISDSGNYTAFSAWAADAQAQVLDLFMAAVVQLQAANEDPNVIIVNPKDWLTMYQLKDSTYGYLRGLSFDNAAGAMSLMGVPVVRSNKVTLGDYFVGDAISGAMIFDRKGLTVEFFEQDSDNVTKNLITVRAEQSLAFPVFKPSAWIYGVIATDVAKIVNYS